MVFTVNTVGMCSFPEVYVCRYEVIRLITSCLWKMKVS